MGRYWSKASAMPTTSATIELPEDLRAFAEERVRAGKAATVEEVVATLQRTSHEDAVTSGQRMPYR